MSERLPRPRALRVGLRWQILATFVLLMAATFVLASLAFLGTTQHHMQRQAVGAVERLGSLAAATTVSALAPGQPVNSAENRVALETLCALFAAHADGARVAFLAAPHGSVEVLASAPPVATVTFDPDAEVALRAGRASAEVGVAADGVRQVRVLAPVVVGDAVVGLYRFEVPLRDVQQATSVAQQLVLLYLGLVVGVVLVAGLLLMTRLVARPIARVSAATERVASGDLATRVALPRRGLRTELHDLADNFDAMVDALRASRAATEARVAEIAASKATLEQTQQALVASEKLATVGTLAAGIAHEIGNPLAATMGLVELLRDRDGLSDTDLDDALGRVDAELRRIHQTIGELLEYARSSAGDEEVVTLHAPLDTARSLAAHHPRGRGLRVDATGVPQVQVLANENRLVQVFLNLFLNAADATAGAGEVRIAATTVDRDGQPWVRIDVRDDGPGVPDAARDKVFTPFYTTKARGEGTGLGLAMTQAIVHRYGGDIVLAEDGPGACFEVWLRAA